MCYIVSITRGSTSLNIRCSLYNTFIPVFALTCNAFHIAIFQQLSLNVCESRAGYNNKKRNTKNGLRCAMYSVTSYIWRSCMAHVINQWRERSWNANTAVPVTRTTASMMKEMRSMTAAAIIHWFINCWFLSVWWRNWASLRSLVSSRSWIEANRHSTELLLSPARVDADADTDDAIFDWWWLTLFESLLVSGTSSTASLAVLILYSPGSVDEIIFFIQATDAIFSYISLLSC